MALKKIFPFSSGFLSLSQRILLAQERGSILYSVPFSSMPMWWNGRRGRLKIYSRRLGAGSSPVIGIQKEVLLDLLFISLLGYWIHFFCRPFFLGLGPTTKSNFSSKKPSDALSLRWPLFLSRRNQLQVPGILHIPV